MHLSGEGIDFVRWSSSSLICLHRTVQPLVKNVETQGQNCLKFLNGYAILCLGSWKRNRKGERLWQKKKKKQ